MTENNTQFLRSRVAFMAACTFIALIAGGVGGYITQNLTGGGSAGAGTAVTWNAIRDYILENPEILPEAIRRLDAKGVTASIDASRKKIEKPYAGSWEGNPNGDVIVVEFFDYACGYCKATLGDIAKVLAEDKNLKVVYREMPVLSEDSGLAARVSLLAAQQGKYMAFHRAMYAVGPPTRDKILAAAVRAGIDRQAAETAMTNTALDTEINNNSEVYRSLKGSGTPLFVIGNQIINNAPGYAGLKEAIAKARAEG